MIYTPVKLDKSRNVVLGFQALQEFKKITGESLTKINFESDDLEVESVIPAIFYAGLKHEDKELTYEKTVALLDEYLGIKQALDIIPQIIQDAFGEVEKK